MSNQTAWSKYIDATADGALNVAIAERIGVDPATVGRWRTGAVDPKPRQVVAYARAFGLNPIQALIAAGYLAEDEVELPAGPPKSYSLGDFSTLELAEEVASRLSIEGVHDVAPNEPRPGQGLLVPLFDVPGLGQDDLLAVASDSEDTRPDDRSDEDFY